jgi:hypothetical protein
MEDGKMQRAGKTHKAALGDGMADMKMKQFFSHAANLLEQNGNDDAAYYFNQVVDHIVAGESIPSDDRQAISRLLGL